MKKRPKLVWRWTKQGPWTWGYYGTPEQLKTGDDFIISAAVLRRSDDSGIGWSVTLAHRELPYAINSISGRAKTVRRAKHYCESFGRMLGSHELMP